MRRFIYYQGFWYVSGLDRVELGWIKLRLIIARSSGALSFFLFFLDGCVCGRCVYV